LIEKSCFYLSDSELSEMHGFNSYIFFASQINE